MLFWKSTTTLRHSLVLGLFLVGANAQGNLTFANTQSLCNKTFADANATGIYTFSPNISGYGIQDVGYALTLYENATSEQWALWFDTGGAYYGNDMKLGYDVCSIRISNLTVQTNYDGRNDTGTCTSTFNQACVGALTDLASSTADSMISNGDTYAPLPNLTGNALGPTCQGIASAIEQSVPKECRNFFAGGPVAVAQPLTNRTSSSSGGPDVHGVSCLINGSYAGVYTSYVPHISDGDYDIFAQEVWPMLTIWMPVVNINRPVNFASHSVLTCAHFDHFSEGSRVVLPEAPETGNGGLDKGAIAGIVVGVVIACALVLAFGWLFWRRRRRSRKPAEASPVADHKPTEDESPAELPLEGAEKSELDARGGRPELDGVGEKFELGTESRKAELEAGGVKSELDGQQVSELPSGGAMERAELAA